MERLRVLGTGLVVVGIVTTILSVGALRGATIREPWKLNWPLVASTTAGVGALLLGEALRQASGGGSSREWIPED